MQFYAGTSKQFVQDSIQNQIAEKLRLAYFEHNRFQPGASEVRSWQNSLRAMSQVIQYAKLDDHGVILEYQLPMTSQRIDCIITGHNQERSPSAVIVELKQWEKCAPSDGERIITWLGGGQKMRPHPSVQVGSYRHYLANCHTAFHEGEDAIQLESCCYLHNYTYVESEPLLHEKYRRFILESPLFSKDDVDPLKDFLQVHLQEGDGWSLVPRIQQSRYRPSQKLMDEVRKVIKQKSEYVMLDDQIVATDFVRTIVRKGWHKAKKHVVIVKGGPGTGKSVIAINLLADFLREKYVTHYATGSRAFTESLRAAIGSRSAPFFRYFSSYGNAEPGTIDILIADEAHRIRAKSIGMFMKKSDYPERAQIEELLAAAKVSVFFIDDDQVVRHNEIGSVSYLKESAARVGADVHEFELQVQFRCMGSDAFVNWINNTLGIKRTANVIWEGKENFDFQIKDSPEALEAAIREKVAQGNTGRVCAGYVWHWSMPNPDGTLLDDVVIGDYRRPWDAKPEARVLAPGIPPATLWAYDPNGINQIGCVYNAQGFEFDYVGVIFGPDLRFDPKAANWIGDPSVSHDTVVKKNKETFLRNVKNTYRILLSRGIKGCYVYFMDEDTRNFFRSRMA